MAIYTEEIQLKDGISAPAAAANRAVASLGSSLEAAQAGMIKAQALGDTVGFDKAAADVKKYSDALAALPKQTITAQMPAVAPPPVAAPAPAVAPTTGAPVGATAPPAAPEATPISAAAAAADAYAQALAKAGAAKQVVAQVPAPGTEGYKALQAASASLTEELKKTEAEMQKANALGDEEGFVKASAKAGELQGQIAKLPAPAKETKRSLSDLFGDAAHAAQMGKESIGAAVGDIKNAFASLAQGDAKGAVMGLFDAVADLSKMLDLVVPGLGQAVSAVIKIAGGLVGITVGLIQSGMELAISATQDKEAMLSMFDALGQGTVTGGELDDMLSDLSNTIGISKDKLAGLTKEFLKMGVTGVDQLHDLTLAAESANAIVGQGGAEAFTALQKKIQAAAQTGGQMKIDDRFLRSIGESGASIDDVAKGLGLTREQLKGASVDASKLGNVLTDAIIKKGAGPLARLGNTWTEIKGKFMSNLGDMFEDLADSVDPFMKEVRSLFDIFGQAQPSGQALKAGIMAFFKETFAVAAKLVPMVKHFLLDMIIYGLKAYIAVKPIAAKMKEFFASAEGSKALTVVLDVLVGALKAVGVVILGVVAVATLIAATFGAIVVATWSAVGVFISFASTLIGAVVDAISGAIDALKGWVDSGPQMAMDFITGLVGGITGGGGLVTSAISSLAGSLIDVFKTETDSHSPSKKFAKLGRGLGEGLVVGADEVAPDVHGAIGSMADVATQGAVSNLQALPPPAPAPALPPAGASAPSSSGASIVFEAGAIQINGAGKDVLEVNEEIWAAITQRLAVGAGVG